MSHAENDLPLLIVVAGTRVSIDETLAATAARLPGCRAVRAADLSSRLATRAGISALEHPTAETDEPLLQSAMTVLVAAPAQTALRLKAAHPATVTVALVDVSHLRLRAVLRDPHRSPESEQIDFLAHHSDKFDYVVRLSSESGPYLNNVQADHRAPEADTLVAIVQAERHRTSRQQRLLEQIRMTTVHAASGGPHDSETVG
jgi:hypothetical protein